MKFFEDIPWWARAIFAFIVIVLGVSGFELTQEMFDLSNGRNIESPENKKLQKVQITVRDSQTRAPVENVRLQIVFSGPPVEKTTDRNGYIEIEIPPRDSVQITFLSRDYITTTETINLEADPGNTRVIELDPL
ncbi:MAG: hypothetical protein F6J97_17480 [Leptolyngbya sp. SIO4C1]|nr:hypothetical protein [Leptolyngbya sp. SIO4C1]